MQSQQKRAAVESFGNLLFESAGPAFDAAMIFFRGSRSCKEGKVVSCKKLLSLRPPQESPSMRLIGNWQIAKSVGIALFTRLSGTPKQAHPTFWSKRSTHSPSVGHLFSDGRNKVSGNPDVSLRRSVARQLR